MTHSKAKWLPIFYPDRISSRFGIHEVREQKSQTLFSFGYVVKLTGEVHYQTIHLVKPWQIFHSYRRESTGLAVAALMDW
jgi:hypothetical protein